MGFPTPTTINGKLVYVDNETGLPFGGGNEMMETANRDAGFGSTGTVGTTALASYTNASNPYSGMPEEPAYYEAMSPGTRGSAYEAIQKEGMTPAGTVTPWMQAQRGIAAQGFKESATMAQDAARKAAQSSAAQMSMQGGLTGGARERLLQGKGLMAAQGAAKAGTEYQRGLMDIGSTAEKNRLASLSAAGNMENQALNRDVQLQQMRNAYTQGIYGNRMNAWAANKTAEAQAKYA